MPDSGWKRLSESADVKKASANDKLTMGVVGIPASPQSRSLGVIDASRPGVRANQLTFTLGCDVDGRHRTRATAEMPKKGFRKDFAATTGEYRDLINNKSLDALLVTTPDRWHAQVTIEPLKAGKDVYCEKPLTLTVAEATGCDEGR